MPSWLFLVLALGFSCSREGPLSYKPPKAEKERPLVSALSRPKAQQEGKAEGLALPEPEPPTALESRPDVPPPPEDVAPPSLADLSPAILSRSMVFEDKVTISLLKSESQVIAWDLSGEIVSMDALGNILWRFALSGSSRPILSMGLLYLSGSSEFDIVDAVNGHLLAKGPALGPGVRLAPYPGGIVAASMFGLSIFMGEETSPSQSIPVEGGALAASLYGKDILVARASGGLALLDPESGSVLASAEGPSSPYLLLSESDDKAVLAGILPGDSDVGSVVVYSLPDLKPVWSSDLDFHPQSEPAIGKEGVFVWGQGVLKAFSPEGQASGDLDLVCAPPLLSNGVLYYGLVNRSFVAARPSDLESLVLIALPAALAGRPQPYGKELRLPLVDGSVVSLDTEKMLQGAN